MSDRTTYHQRNREIRSNKEEEYYKNNKEILREQVRNKYKDLSDEEKNIEKIWKK